jgi:hypothetical protein
MQLKAESMTLSPTQLAALSRVREHDLQAQAELNKYSDTNPILKDKNLTSQKLNVKDAAALGEVLREDADDRLADIEATSKNLDADADFVFGLSPIIEHTLTLFGAASSPIYGQIVDDYKSHLDQKEALVALGLGALAIGLSLLTLGGGALALGAAGGLAATGVANVAIEGDKYLSGHAAANTAFDRALSVSSEEPSAFWVAFAIAGLGFDGAQLLSAFKAALPAARLLRTTGVTLKFEAEIAKATALTGAMKDALRRAGGAEQSFQGAIAELKAASAASAKRRLAGMLGDEGITGNYGGFGGVIDELVLEKFMQTAYYAIKKGVTDFDVFVREARRARFAESIDFDRLTTEQTDALRKAFDVEAARVLQEVGVEGKVVGEAAGGAVGVPSHIARKISQKQLRHVHGRPEWEARGQGSYLKSSDDAQAVLDAVHNGNARILGTTKQGHLVVEFKDVTGFNNNPGSGFVDQPTNIFMIKGTAAPSVVPTSPTWKP